MFPGIKSDFSEGFVTIQENIIYLSEIKKQARKTAI